MLLLLLSQESTAMPCNCDPETLAAAIVAYLDLDNNSDFQALMARVAALEGGSPSDFTNEFTPEFK